MFLIFTVENGNCYHSWIFDRQRYNPAGLVDYFKFEKMKKDIQMVDLQTQYAAIREEVEEAIAEVLRSARFIQGPVVKEFEDHLARYLGVKHVIGCANGTDALQIALMALNLPAESEIIVPDFTFIATAEVVSLLGHIPVFADVDPHTFNIAPASIRKNITRKTAAIIPVHLFGQSCDMAPILEIAREYDLAVVEDNAQAIGSVYIDGEKEMKAGTIGDIGCTSFFPSKNLGCYGDGGALFTNDDELAHQIRMIANHGMETRYYHDLIGVNSRLDSLQAAVLDIKLRKLDEYNAARYEAAQKYNAIFEGLHGVRIPRESRSSRHVFHQYTLKIEGEGRRDRLKERLDQEGIPSGIYYPVPLHRQKAFHKNKSRHGDCSQSIELSRKVISLPMHTELTDEMIRYVGEVVISYLEK